VQRHEITRVNSGSDGVLAGFRVEEHRVRSLPDDVVGAFARPSSQFHHLLTGGDPVWFATARVQSELKKPKRELEIVAGLDW